MTFSSDKHTAWAVQFSTMSPGGVSTGSLIEDMSGHGNHGTLYNESVSIILTKGTQLPPGIFFDNAGSNVHAHEAEALMRGFAFTLEIWMKFGPKMSFMTDVGSYIIFRANNHFSLRLYSDGTISAPLWTSHNKENDLGIFLHNMTTLHCIAITFNGTVVTYYKNGIPIANEYVGNLTYLESVSGSIRIGKTSPRSQLKTVDLTYFSVRLSDIARSPHEIWDQYVTGKSCDIRHFYTSREDS